MHVSVDPEQLQRTFARFAEDAVFAESRRAVEAGRLPVEMFQALSLQPGLLDAFTAISRGVYPGGLVEREVKEIIILEASTRNHCQFCTASHVAMCRALGMADDPLNLLTGGDPLSRRQQCALALTRAVMTDSNAVPPSVFDALRSVFTEPEIVELVFMIGFINCLNLFNNTLGIRYHGEYPDPA